jgi:hypothetical protein
MSVEAASGPSLVGIPGKSVEADEGAVRVLLESKFLFDVVDLESDLASYPLLILPDAVRVGPELKAKVDAFAGKGGRVLLTGRSGIDPVAGCLFDTGAEWLGTSENVGGDYVLPVEDLRASFVNDPLFMYGPAEKLRVLGGASLGAVYEPYFDRTRRRFSGHVNTPSKPEPEAHVAGVEKGPYVQFAFPIFSIYQRVGAVAMLEIAERLIGRALARPRLVETGLPRAARVTMRRQGSERRDVVHLLCASPALRGNLRGNPVQPIQDLVPVHSVTVDIATEKPVSHVRLVPEGTELPFESKGGRLSFTVPRVLGHQMVEIYQG